MVGGSHKAYEPDALVYCDDPLPDDTTVIPNPLIVVEVISPSTGHIDKGDKLEAYFSIASLHHYLLVYPDRRSLCTTSGPPARNLQHNSHMKGNCNSTRSA